MSENQRSRKLRRFFTAQSLQVHQQDFWLEPSETHHLRDSIRLKIGDTCLITDGQGREAEAVILEFDGSGRAHLDILKRAIQQKIQKRGCFLRVMPALLRKGKTDLVIEKAQELCVDEIRPIFSERCEVKLTKEKIGKVMDRWNRIAREASKQSGSLNVLRIAEPVDFKKAVSTIAPDEVLVIFHPCKEAVPFSDLLTELKASKEKNKVLNILIGPEGGFSDDEISWVRWKRNEKQYRLVSLGEVLLKADTAFVGIVSTLQFSGVLVS
ncbi:MAG TPA: RsmE family RNA methyltransferase [Candidatus Omnitrophota bacterium]|nr:RsmE family RNA methyltransferase [Candidatus Omnitrophota bacterium]